MLSCWERIVCMCLFWFKAFGSTLKMKPSEAEGTSSFPQLPIISVNTKFCLRHSNVISVVILLLEWLYSVVMPDYCIPALLIPSSIFTCSCFCPMLSFVEGTCYTAKWIRELIQLKNHLILKPDQVPGGFTLRPLGHLWGRKGWYYHELVMCREALSHLNPVWGMCLWCWLSFLYWPGKKILQLVWKLC